MLYYALFFVPKNHLDNEKVFCGAFSTEERLLKKVEGKEVHNLDIENEDFDNCYVYRKYIMDELEY